MNSGSICEFISDKHYTGNVKIINFVYEADFKNLPQPFFKPVNIIYLVTRGDGVLKNGNGEFPLETGCIFFTFSGRFFEIEADEDFEYMYISFMGDSIPNVFESLGINHQTPVFYGFDYIRDFWLEAIRRINPTNAGLLSESVLLYTLSFMTAGQNTNTNKDEESLSNSIVEYVNSHYTDAEISLKQLAGIFQYSQKYVSFLFKKLTNVGFSDYLNHLRIQHALSLINDKVTSVTQISELSGFSDPLYFSKVFKKKMGISPTTYIQQKGDK